MKLPRIEQHLVGVAILLFASVFGLIYLLQQVDIAKQVTADTRQTLALEKSRTASGQDADTYEALLRLREELEQHLTPLNQEVRFFEQLDKLADRFVIESSLRLLTEPTTEGPQTIQMELTLTGTYANVMNFIGALNDEPTIVVPTALTLNRNSQPGEVRGIVTFDSYWR